MEHLFVERLVKRMLCDNKINLFIAKFELYSEKYVMVKNKESRKNGMDEREVEAVR